MSPVNVVSHKVEFHIRQTCWQRRSEGSHLLRYYPPSWLGAAHKANVNEAALSAFQAHVSKVKEKEDETEKRKLSLSHLLTLVSA